MVNNTQDIGFQPTQKEYSFYNKELKRQKRNKFLKTFFTLIFGAVVFVFGPLAFLNYFNMLPNTLFFQKTFRTLPHLYDLSGTKNTLAKVSDLGNNEYNIEATLINVSKNRVIVDYNGNVAELLLGTELRCEKITILRQPEDDETIVNEPAFCGTILKAENINKLADITYKKIPQGTYVLTNIAIKE